MYIVQNSSIFLSSFVLNVYYKHEGEHIIDHFISFHINIMCELQAQRLTSGNRKATRQFSDLN